MIDLRELDPPPAGFGRCGRCTYRDVSRAIPKRGIRAWQVCYACASRSMAAVPARACKICQRELGDDDACENVVCRWPLRERHFTRSHAIAQHTSMLRKVIAAYKFDGRRGWALIIGRILVGYLDAHREEFAPYDLIVPSPTYTGEGGRPFDHTGLVIEFAEAEAALHAWPFARGVVHKTAATERFTGKRWREREEIARLQIRPALTVPDPSAVRGKRVLVYDDVFTEGLTIREVARALRRAGAVEVSEVVLARQPWRR